MIKRIENMGSHLLSDCQNIEEGMQVNVSPHIYPVPAYEIIASHCFDSAQRMSLDYVIMSTQLVMSTRLLMSTQMSM